MEKFSKVRVYGKAKSDDSIDVFDGEIVTAHDVDSEKVEFYFNFKKYLILKKNCVPVSFLYPNFIYVRDGAAGINHNSEKVEVQSIEVANCYARRGSHWIKFIALPEDLTIQLTEREKELSIDNEDFSDSLGLTHGHIVIDRESLKYQLKQEGFSEDQILKIIECTYRAQ